MHSSFLVLALLPPPAHCLTNQFPHCRKRKIKYGLEEIILVEGVC